MELQELYNKVQAEIEHQQLESKRPFYTKCNMKQWHEGQVVGLQYVADLLVGSGEVSE